MIGNLQKVKVLARTMLSRMKAGEAPSVSRALPDVAAFLQGRRFGAPLARLRAAALGQPIGGESGLDIQFTLEEIREDLSLLYEAVIKLTTRVIDQYDIFSVRRDRQAIKLNQFRLDVSTLLAQQSAGRRASVVDSFNTLDFIDAERTTAQIDLDEGLATLPPDSGNSIRYDGTRVTVARAVSPPGAVAVGPPFPAIFSPYRLDAWYISLPVGTEYEAHVNVTGADYERGATEEIQLNCLRIDPTGPLHIEVDWSPDSFNWHKMSPPVAATIRDKTSFHFSPITVGFLRFKLRHSEEITAAGANQLRPVGLKRIELMARGFSSNASVYSVRHTFAEPVHTLVAELDMDKPYGTLITPYVAQDPEGPWIPLLGAPVVFDNINYRDDHVDPHSVVEETTDSFATMWQFGVPSNQQPLPETGELIAGRGQLQIAAYPFDWKLLGNEAHIPELEDWTTPLGEVRQAVFMPVGDIADAGLATDVFNDNKNPVGVDTRQGGYTVFTVIENDGEFSLQPGFTYRFRAYLFCPAPVTLERQSVGVLNPAAAGGTAAATVAPLSLFINGRKVYQQATNATVLEQLSGSTFTTTMAFTQGWNALELCVQLPASLTAGANGLASGDVYIYLQPNLFSPNLENDLGIQYVQAYGEPWRRYSEFDLRHNVPILTREAWAWKLDISEGVFTHILLNHDPVNRATHPAYQTLDGVNASYPVDLILRYPVEKTGTDTRGLYFRADFVQNPGVSAPPVLRSYRLVIN